jgi:hypothetical protein
MYSTYCDVFIYHVFLYLRSVAHAWRLACSRDEYLPNSVSDDQITHFQLVCAYGTSCQWTFDLLSAS